jgi:WD40 repeat protein
LVLYYRNLFISSGSDGSVKLFHIQEKQPLRHWDPVPPPGSSSGAFSALNSVKFSPIKPAVFAVGSADGFLYLFDMSVSMSSPVVILEALVSASPNRNRGIDGVETDTAAHKLQAGRRRAGITSLAFNHKQRDLLAACDVLGRVHIWKLSWQLSNRENYEQSILDNLGARLNNE